MSHEPYAIESCREGYNTRIRVIAQNYHRIKQIRHQSWAPGATQCLQGRLGKLSAQLTLSLSGLTCNCDCVDCHYNKCRHTLHSLLHFSCRLVSYSSCHSDLIKLRKYIFSSCCKHFDIPGQIEGSRLRLQFNLIPTAGTGLTGT